MKLPAVCEHALFERFMKAEAMILWAIRAAQQKDVPPEAMEFLRRHEEEESRHLRHFEELLGITSHRKKELPRVPSQWFALSVQLYGYETLGLEFGKLLAAVRPDMSDIVTDEESHVAFFENQVRGILESGGPPAAGARQYAQAWRRRLPPTVDRYLEDPTLTPFRAELRLSILNAIDERFATVGLTAE